MNKTIQYEINIGNALLGFYDAWCTMFITNDRRARRVHSSEGIRFVVETIDKDSRAITHRTERLTLTQTLQEIQAIAPYETWTLPPIKHNVSITPSRTHVMEIILGRPIRYYDDTKDVEYTAMAFRVKAGQDKKLIYRLFTDTFEQLAESEIVDDVFEAMEKIANLDEWE